MSQLLRLSPAYSHLLSDDWERTSGNFVNGVHTRCNIIKVPVSRSIQSFDKTPTCYSIIQAVTVGADWSQVEQYISDDYQIWLFRVARIPTKNRSINLSLRYPLYHNTSHQLLGKRLEKSTRDEIHRP